MPITVKQAIVFSITGVAVACAAVSQSPTVNPHYNASKAHHTPTGFRNLDPAANEKESFWAWQWERWKNGVPKPPVAGYEAFAASVTMPLDRALIGTRSETPRVTWLGHASVWVQVAGLNVITDPHLNGYASPFSFAGPRRKVVSPIKPEELPPVDLVLISHNHYDHLDEITVDAIARTQGEAPIFVVPLGIKAFMNARGIKNVIELDWWDRFEHKGVTVHFVPAQHWSGRWIDDRWATLWGGFVVETRGATPWRFFYSGDTGYSAAIFQEIGKRFAPIDLAAIPIGAYEPRWFMQRQHVNPDEAVRIHQDVGAKRSLGVHWGTFELTDEPLDEPPAKLAEALAARGVAAEAFWLFKHGETRDLAIR